MSAHYPDARHGVRGLIVEFIDDPDRRGGRVFRQYGRRMMRRLAASCDLCHEADAHRLRLRRIHVAYRRRGAAPTRSYRAKSGAGSQPTEAARD